MKRGIFGKRIFVISIRDYKRFKKFNESDKLYNKILKTFSLPTNKELMKSPMKTAGFKILSFEIAFLEDVINEDMDAYINEITLSVIHKFSEIGALYDNNLNHIYFCESSKYNKALMKKYKSLME